MVAFDRTHTIYVVFHSRRFHDVLWVLNADARSFEVLVAILVYVPHLVSMSRYRSDARQAAFLLILAVQVMTMSGVGGQPKNHANTS